MSITPPQEADEILRRLELTITRRLDGLLFGDYRGLVPGHGSEAGETRLYVPGDDIRRIDWNVTARMQTPHVRQTIAERELETWLLVDLSASLDFGTAQCTKRDLALAAVAAAGFLTLRQGNRLGAVLLTSQGRVTIPARSGRRHLRSVLHRVYAAPRGDGGGLTDLEIGMRQLVAPGHRRGLAVVISDFLAPSTWERPLRIASARHEVLAVEIIDPREMVLPDVGTLVVSDPETGQQLEVDTDQAEVLARYAAAAHEQRLKTAGVLRAAGVDHLVLRTDSDWLVDLVRFVALRRHRATHMRRTTQGAGS